MTTTPDPGTGPRSDETHAIGIAVPALAANTLVAELAEAGIRLTTADWPVDTPVPGAPCLFVCWLRDVDELARLERLHDCHPDVPSLALTATPALSARALRVPGVSVVSQNAASSAIVAGARAAMLGLRIVGGAGEPVLPTTEADVWELVDQFTDAERELLTLLTTDEPYEAIAARLGASARTIKRHVARLQRQFGVGTRARLAAIAGSAGLLARDR